MPVMTYPTCPAHSLSVGKGSGTSKPTYQEQVKSLVCNMRCYLFKGFVIDLQGSDNLQKEARIHVSSFSPCLAQDLSPIHTKAVQGKDLAKAESQF